MASTPHSKNHRLLMYSAKFFEKRWSLMGPLRYYATQVFFVTQRDVGVIA